MLATQHSPSVSPQVKSPRGDRDRDLGYLRQTKSPRSRDSPINPPRGLRSSITSSHTSSTLTSSDPTTNTASKSTNNTSTNADTSSLSTRCSSQSQSSSLPQPHHSPATSRATASKATQTSPNHLDCSCAHQPRPAKVPKLQMVDAQTQYSPSLKSSLSRVEDPTPSATPATQIASLHIKETEPSTPSSPRRPRTRTAYDPVTDAAMSTVPTGTITQPYTQPQHPAPSTPPPSEPTRPTSKRNHSVSVSREEHHQDIHNQTEPTSSTTSAQQPQPSQPTPKKLRPDDASVKPLPRDYSFCPTRDLVLLISSMLMDLIRYNDTIPSHSSPQNLTRFHSRAPPAISVTDYLQRLTTHATLAPPILLSMVYYIDKLCALYPAFTISSLTVHRFLITAATVASKGLSDSFWTNKTYARVGGVSVKELALLELEFLVRVQWRIVPQPEVLVDYYRSLVGRTVGYDFEQEQLSHSQPAEHSEVHAGNSGNVQVEAPSEQAKEAG